MNEEPRVWSWQRPINLTKQAEMVGGVAAPLLAGFSLTTIVLLVVSSYRPWLAVYAIAMFALAAALLLNALQFSATALGYAATPSERLDYVPEAAANTHILGAIRRRQWEEASLRSRYLVSARFCYNFGLLAFLGGLGLIIVPRSSWPWPAGQFIGVAVVGMSIVFEILWVFSKARWPKSLFPRPSPGKPLVPKASKNGAPYMADEDARYLLFDGIRPEETGSGDIYGNLRKCVELLEQMTIRLNDQFGGSRESTYEDSARACMTEGKFADAIRKLGSLLAWRERLLGYDNPSTLRTRADLAIAHLEAGRAATAIPEFEKVYDSWSRALGPKHPETWRAWCNLACARELATQDAAGSDLTS
jgi:hypothetical protein